MHVTTSYTSKKKINYLRIYMYERELTRFSFFKVSACAILSVLRDYFYLVDSAVAGLQHSNYAKRNFCVSLD